MTSRAGGGANSLSSTASQDEEDRDKDVKGTRHLRAYNTRSGINRQEDRDLLCGDCGKDLTSEPTSVRCDGESCRKLFHPSCLGDEGPLDSEKWQCHWCQTKHEPSSAVSQAIHALRAESGCDNAPNSDSTGNKDISNCPLCKKAVGENDCGIGCDGCDSWFHSSCLYIDDTEYNDMAEDSSEWFCDVCRSMHANAIKWGLLTGEKEITEKVSAVYQEIVKWRKNMFLVPRGKSGLDFIKELTRLILLFVDSTKWERLSFSLVHIFLPIMLQKPSRNSKARDHAKYLSRRLVKWKNGELGDLMEECRSIQRALRRQEKNATESQKKAFCRLMLLGKVKQATKFIDNTDNTVGVHRLTRKVKQLLEDKHPSSVDAAPEVLLSHDTPSPQPVIFEVISAETVLKACMDLDGSGGQTLTDSDAWKHIICSKSFGKTSLFLAESIANAAKRLCREDIHYSCLKEFTACRLIPLNKGDDKLGNPGVRPIGIGEILRRIIGKSVISSFRTEIQVAAGPLQTCAGLKSGIEACIHAMKLIWDDDATEAVLQVDADNAFNRLNRTAALHNIHEICPPLYQYLKNHYQMPADLIVNTVEDHYKLKSDEGSTQGMWQPWLSMPWASNHWWTP